VKYYFPLGIYRRKYCIDRILANSIYSLTKISTHNFVVKLTYYSIKDRSINEVMRERERGSDDSKDQRSNFVCMY
jgi:hypothetical protein